MRSSKFYLEFLNCPACRGELLVAGEQLHCKGCGKTYPFQEGKSFFAPLPQDARRLEDKPPNKARWSQVRRSLYAFFEEHLRREDTNKILCDLATGTSPYRELTETFERTVGVDFLPYTYVQVVADVTQPLPFKDASFDIVLFSEVLEHVPNPELVLSEIARILKPGGYCLGSVPFLHPIHYQPYDFYRYTNFALERLFAGAGFTQSEIIPLGLPMDVMKIFQDRFFNHYATQTVFSGNAYLNRAAHVLLRVVRKIHHMLFKTLAPLYKRVPVSPDLVLGYCFKIYRS
jgi:SAM-dependent methyltransferase